MSGRAGFGGFCTDLHMHSLASDGVLTPAQLMDAAAQKGMRLVALTDHDTCDGIPEAKLRAEELGMVFIPGIELSCGGEKEIHILGYGIDPLNPGLMAFREQRRADRLERAEQMMQILAEAGMPIDRESVYALVSGVIGRPHIAAGMVSAGYVHTVQEAFEQYIAQGRPFYVPRPEVPVREGCRVIREAGGIPVLAHPMELRSGEAVLSSLVHEWRGQGLAGIEIYHPSTPSHKIAMLLGIARQEGLLVTGGSDYHGIPKRHDAIGQGMDRWDSAPEDLERLFLAMGRPFPREKLFL